MKDTNVNAIPINKDFKEILTNPILDIAANFWEQERYEAFKICYTSMRLVDDLVDNRKSTLKKISKAEEQEIISKIRDSIKSISKGSTNAVQKELAETMARFQIPQWPWQLLSESMVYDIKNDGFSTFQEFLNYTEGAAVSPASVFMHLCGVEKKNGNYFAPKFDVKKAARPLALFAYVVHIIRDFQKDHKDNLNYFADDLITKNNLDKQMLKDIAAGGILNSNFRNLIKEYYDIAEDYRNESRKMIDETSVYLEPRYKLSLELIYSLYLQIFERIDVNNGTFTAEELNPPPEEVKERISQTIC